ncbi:invasion associated locus B family protein [Roseibium aggregatum]|uniref:Invasion associated locus B family protein n=1 Tax=Roseibium aggregatum TaxID=187304 RepID=A0A939EAA4_9HYPH|nr:invasion associated locus B family protein [Roseibium aggregatum]MBN9668947.1 invasion associated locus B family protein [Roseibium aggregatum]
MLSFYRLLVPAAAFSLALLSPPALAQSPNPDDLWQTRCAGPSRAPETLTCEASQSVRVKDSGQIVFKVDIIYPSKNADPILQMQAPLGFFLPGKIKLAVDGTPMSELEVGTCDARGCFLSARATTAMIDAMKAGAQLQIDFAPVADKRQMIEVPLTGFSRAMTAIQ